MKKIYLYQDYVFNNDVVRNRLIDVFGHTSVVAIDSETLQQNLKQTPPDLFVMPGGADLYLCEKLTQDTITALKEYVSNGGSYLGICSGAYFASSSIKWAENHPDYEIIDKRPLCFHKGKATGPISTYCKDKNSPLFDSVCTLSNEAGHTFKCLYRSGPVFEEGHGEKVLYRYHDVEDSSAAIIQLNVGRGKVILMSPHLEFRSSDWEKIIYKHGNDHYEQDLEIAKEIKPYDSHIDKVWRSLLTELTS